MSQNENVTAQLANNTQYTLTYQSSNQEWGNFYLKNQTIDPNSSVAIFYAVGAEGSGTGCEGSVIYGFTDQFGNQQTITLTYSDPYIGSNSFGVPSTPSGVTGSANQPGGGPVNVTYTIGGAVTAGEEVPVSSGLSCQSA